MPALRSALPKPRASTTSPSFKTPVDSPGIWLAAMNSLMTGSISTAAAGVAISATSNQHRRAMIASIQPAGDEEVREAAEACGTGKHRDRTGSDVVPAEILNDS